MNNTDHAGPPPLKLGFTRIEAARAIGQSPATLDRLAKRGLIRPSRGTRRPIYALIEIERYLRESSTQGDL